jgi:hypothetical protein
MPPPIGIDVMSGIAPPIICGAAIAAPGIVIAGADIVGIDVGVGVGAAAAAMPPLPNKSSNGALAAAAGAP